MESFNYEAVVGLDFGSSGSGFAYSFCNENDINHGCIYGASVDNKVPTEIILDYNYKILEFGAKCNQYLKENGLNKGHHFNEIKMHLYERKTEIRAKNSGVSFPLVIVIEKFLQKLKELAIEELKKMRFNIKESNIKWVVTVPAIWEEFQKGIMMEACENCGLVNEYTDKSLFFALEPETASLYCLRNKNIDQKYIKKGNNYIICDLGGGTGDIVSHNVGNNEHLEEIEASCGGDYGSNKIDKWIFEDIIKKIFGCSSFNELKKKIKEKSLEEEENFFFDFWCDLELQIKNFKEGTTIKKVENNENYPINLGFFQDFYDGDANDIINDLINNYNNLYYTDDLKLKIKSKRKWIIDFPYKIISKYIKEQTNLISNKIENIINRTDINSIIFVGGYCSNEVLLNSLKDVINKEIKFLQPSKPSLAVMEGAVLFGIDPNIIDTRISRYTIGTDARETWNEEKHSAQGAKVFDEDEKVFQCSDCFSKFIEKNQKIKLGFEVTKNYVMVGPRYCSSYFYKTLKQNPTFVNEEGIDKIGCLKLDAGKDYPRGERSITVTMKFGGTFIDVKSVHKKSGKEVKTKLKFEI